MAINCIVVDDEKPAREGLADYVAQVAFLNLVGVGKSGLEANNLLQTQAVDLMFLDIQMPGLSGLELLQNLKNPPLTVFTTAYREYAVEGFELEAIDYLIKPISFARFLKACNKAQEFYIQQQGAYTPTDDYIFVKTDYQLAKISLSEILYLEAADDYVFIHTSTRRYMALLPLRQVETKLPENQFIRTHRSFIVNKSAIDAVQGNQITIGTHQVPISLSLHDKVYEQVVAGKLWKKGG